MDADFQAFVERVKEATSLEDVIEQTASEFKLRRRHGNSIRGEHHDSLVVRLDEQYFVWNSKGEKGDVFSWLEYRHRWDFMTSLRWLAERAKIEMPKRFSGEGEAGHAARMREDVFGIAQRVFAELLKLDEGAMNYCQGRGWTVRTVEDAGLGFTGRDPAAAVKGLRAEFSMYEYDLDAPEVVCVMGFRGDVKGWGKAHEVQVQDNWIEWGWIPGMTAKKRLVYPHWIGGRVRYLSARQILGDDVTAEGREWKSYNLPVALAGRRQVFFNHVYGRRDDELMIVEGQADAVSLGQWGMSAVALAGAAWEDHEELIGQLRQRHKRIYVGLDADAAGEAGLRGKHEDWPLAKVLGPMARVVRWGGRGA